MEDSEALFSPQAHNKTRVLSQPGFGPEVYKPSLRSILREIEKFFECLVGLLVDYRSISGLETQKTIDDHWHLEGRVMVLKKIGKFFILTAETISDKEDLIHARPWNINSSLLLMRPWLVDTPLHRLDFNSVNMWVQIRGAPLEYITQAMASHLGTLIRHVTVVDRDTVS
ncbi:hypothetical protein Vadar_004422 [Vaccinium darrowii]|uniref:Uncharacterized protein n=1 Tax=Vaccinium darrowii TaxID=229202 RepID=A0ACB7Z9I2_9ERIC|nr:hypothetical protein Vadar_004422 [Vaccinium darrowii]